MRPKNLVCDHVQCQPIHILLAIIIMLFAVSIVKIYCLQCVEQATVFICKVANCNFPDIARGSFFKGSGGLMGIGNID